MKRQDTRDSIECVATGFGNCRVFVTVFCGGKQPVLG